MYQKIKQLYGKKLSATDGHIGHVRDVYFDEMAWTVRYLVVDTGSWLSGRLVLLSAHAFENHPFGGSDRPDDLLLVNLTRKQIENSPSIDTHRPISRQYERDYHAYYGWPVYWQDGGMSGITGFPAIDPPIIPEDMRRGEQRPEDELYLRSTKAVTGYHIQTTSGPIGSVSGFMVDGRNWAICEVVVQTGHWYANKEILILPENVQQISHETSTVFLNLSKENLEETMRDDVAQAGAGHR